MSQVLQLLDAVPGAAWLVAVVVLLVLWRAASSRTGRGNRKRATRAAVAEHHAEPLLARHGYRVTDRQVAGEVTVLVDGESRVVTCRADLIVERRRRRFVAEVKSGPNVTLATHPSTRRQLLEYLYAFDVDGVLLVDMHRKRVVQVEFPFT